MDEGEIPLYVRIIYTDNLIVYDTKIDFCLERYTFLKSDLINIWTIREFPIWNLHQIKVHLHM